MNTPLQNSAGKGFGKPALLTLALIPFLFLLPSVTLLAQCNTASGFTKITNTAGTATYPGTNGNPAVNVAVTSAGDAGIISFCGITNGFRAGVGDRGGSYKFSFSPAVFGVAINLNALSNTPGNREVVRIKINDVLYTITTGDIVCSASCFSCSGVAIAAAGGAVTSEVSPTGNGTGQLLIQGAGLINSIEYINEVQADDPQGSVFELFFNNSTCALPVTLSSFTASAYAAGIQLSWVASIQVAVSYYGVERSTDGVNFKLIAQVPATGNGSYRYEDVTAEAGTNYYRLKMVDTDGSFKYSAIVPINVRHAGAGILPFNPVTDVLTLAGLRGRSTIAIYSATGALQAKVTTDRSLERINTSNWPTGLYIVSVISNGKIMASEKVFKL